MAGRPEPEDTLVKIFKPQTELLAPKDGQVVSAKQLYDILVKLAKFEDGMHRELRSIKLLLARATPNADFNDTVHDLRTKIDKNSKACEALRTLVHNHLKASDRRASRERDQQRAGASFEQEASENGSDAEGENAGGDEEHVEVNVLDFVEQMQALWHFTTFSGSGDTSFSSWIKKMEDGFELQNPEPTSEQKCKRMKFHLAGMARSHFDQLEDAVQKDFSRLKEAFKTRFDSKLAKTSANQRLVSCHQKVGESVGEFAERVRKLVVAATVGEHDEVRKSRLLNEFVERLRSKLKFHVRMAEASTFEQALEAALKYESFLDEQERDLLSTSAGIHSLEIKQAQQNELMQAQLQSMSKLLEQCLKANQASGAQPNAEQRVNDTYEYTMQRRGRQENQGRQALKRPNNAPVSLNPKRGSQAVIRQGPPGEDTESFTHPAEYTVIYITNDNATAVSNAPHPTAPPFIWLNNFTLVEFVGTDGFSQLLQFEVNRAAYGDKFWLLVIGEQNCGLKDSWTRVKGQPQVVFPPNGKPTPHGTALRVRQMADQLAQRSTRLAFVAGKTSNNRFLVADPMTPRRYAKVPLSKVIYSKDNARPPTMNTLIRVQYATLQHVEVTTDNAMVVPMQLGYSFPYRMNRVDEERHQLISAQTITGSEFARLRDNRWFDATKPLESQLRFYLDSILAAITLVHTNRVQDTDSRCITAVPAWDLTEDGHIRLTFEAQYENEKALAKVKQQFKADGRATIRPEVMPRKQPASVSIGNVRTPSSTSIVVEVIVDAAAMEAHWEMTPDQLHNVPFTLSVPVGKVAPPSFREALEKEHLINWITNIDMRDASWAAKGDMLRTIMNYPVLENPAPKLSLGRPLIPSKRGFTLNQGQSDAVHRMMYEQRRVDAIRASAGSGKTVTAAVAAVLIAEHDDTKRVGILAPINEAISAGATDITLEAVTETGDALFSVLTLQSQTYSVGKSAQDVYHDSRFPVMLTHLSSGKYGPLEDKDAQIISNAVEACIDRFHGLQDVEFGLQAIDDEEGNDNGNEVDPLKAALEVVLRVVKPRIILGTVALFERYAPQLSPYLNVYIGDEAGTLAEHQLFSLVYSFQDSRKLALIGDTEQRTNFTADVPRIVEKCGFGPALHKVLNSEHTQVTDLNVTFQFHSKLCELISIFYEDLESGIDDEQRSRFLRSGFPLPTEGVPLIMQDFYSPSTPATGGSWSNALQETTAVQYACIIRKLAPELSVAIVSPYKAACDLPRDILGDTLKHDPKLTVDNVDRLQGQEFDVVIYMTTRTLTIAEREDRDEAERCMHFVGEKARTVVGLTREKEGLIVIGHFGSLRFSEVWRRVLDKAETLTQTVPYGFVDHIDVDALLAAQPSPASQAAEALGGLELLSPPPAAPDLETMHTEHMDAEPLEPLQPPPSAPVLPSTNTVSVASVDEEALHADAQAQSTLIHCISAPAGVGIQKANAEPRPIAIIRPDTEVNESEDPDGNMQLVSEILRNAHQPSGSAPPPSGAAAGTDGSASYAEAAAAAITKPTKSTPKKAVRPRRK